MLCEKCKQRAATVHVSDREVAELSEEDVTNPNFNLHLCVACAEEYHEQVLSRSMLPGSMDGQLKERLRVVSVTGKRTTLRLIRTESEVSPQEWHLMTSRLPSGVWQVGEEITLILTPSELEFLKGNRESP